VIRFCAHITAPQPEMAAGRILHRKKQQIYPDFGFYKIN